MVRRPFVHAPPPLSAGRRVAFVLVTLVALVVDVMTVVPDPAWSGGQRWTVWGPWQPTPLEFSLVMTAVYAVLLLRRWWPLPVLLGMSAFALTFTLAQSPSVPVVGVLVCLYTAAALVRQLWQAYLALVVALLTQAAAVELLVGHDDPDIVVALLVVVGLSLSMWTFGRRDHDALRAAAALPGRFAEHEARGAEHERRRIARELHDIVAHSVSAMMMQAAGARAVASAVRQETPDDERLAAVAQALSTIESTGSQSMRELHRLLGVLRDDDAGAEGPIDGGSSSQPGMGDIAPVVELARQSGLVVEVHTAGEVVQLDPSVGLAAYRVVQETLTNAMKHGGRGAMVDIFASYHGDVLQLQARCRGGHDGARPDGMEGGRGLSGLRERLELIGGSFESGWVGEEFVATAVLPLTPAPHPALEPAVSDGPDASRPAPPADPQALPQPPPPAQHHDRSDGAPGERWVRRDAGPHHDRRLIP